MLVQAKKQLKKRPYKPYERTFYFIGSNISIKNLRGLKMAKNKLDTQLKEAIYANIKKNCINYFKEGKFEFCDYTGELDKECLSHESCPLVITIESALK